MYEKLWNAQTDATLRRVHLTFRDSTTGDNKDPGTLTGIKANVRLNGTGALVTTTNDVAKLNQTDHLGAGYVEFTAAEFTAFDHGELIISVSGIAGVKVEDAQATLYTFDPNDPGASAADIATQVRTELAAELALIDAATSSRLAAAGYTAPDNAGIASIETTLAGGMTLDAAERAAIADALLVRNQKGGSDGPADQSVSAALAGGFLNFTITNGVATIKNGDGTTAFTRTLTRDQTMLLGAILAAF